MLDKDYRIWYHGRSILLQGQKPQTSNRKAQSDSSSQMPINQALPTLSNVESFSKCHDELTCASDGHLMQDSPSESSTLCFAADRKRPIRS